MSAAFLLIAIGGCMGYVPGRQSYWDAKLKDMCNTDGGTTVYERVQLSQEDYRRLGGFAGVISIPDERSARSDYPFISRTIETVINQKNPRVVRWEILYIRRSDAKVLAKVVDYSRIGGDFPSYAHPSHLSCRRADEELAALRAVFKVQGDGK